MSYALTSTPLFGTEMLCLTLLWNNAQTFSWYRRLVVLPPSGPPCVSTSTIDGGSLLAATVPGGGRGGVAIIVRDPLSVTTLDSFTGKHGQCISVAVHGQALPLMVSCCYRRPGPDLEVLEPLAKHVQAFWQRLWLVGGDFNLNPSLGPLSDLLKSFGGRVAATGKHLTSTTPTDSIWQSQGLEIVHSRTLDPLVSVLPPVMPRLGNFAELSLFWLLLRSQTSQPPGKILQCLPRSGKLLGPGLRMLRQLSLQPGSSCQERAVPRGGGEPRGGPRFAGATAQAVS